MCLRAGGSALQPFDPPDGRLVFGDSVELVEGTGIDRPLVTHVVGQQVVARHAVLDAPGRLDGEGLLHLPRHHVTYGRRVTLARGKKEERLAG